MANCQQEEEGGSAGNGRDFFLDTQGACFLCLQDPSSGGDKDFSENEAVGLERVCLRDVCRFLEIKGLRNSGYGRNGGGGAAQEEYDFVVDLCGKCCAHIKQLSEYIRVLEETQSGIAKELQDVQVVLKGCKLREECKLQWKKIRKNYPAGIGIIEYLREETGRKGSEKLKILTATKTTSPTRSNQSLGKSTSNLNPLGMEPETAATSGTAPPPTSASSSEVPVPIPSSRHPESVIETFNNGSCSEKVTSSTSISKAPPTPPIDSSPRASSNWNQMEEENPTGTAMEPENVGASIADLQDPGVGCEIEKAGGSVAAEQREELSFLEGTVGRCAAMRGRFECLVWSGGCGKIFSKVEALRMHETVCRRGAVGGTLEEEVEGGTMQSSNDDGGNAIKRRALVKSKAGVGVNGSHQSGIRRSARLVGSGTPGGATYTGRTTMIQKSNKRVPMRRPSREALQISPPSPPNEDNQPSAEDDGSAVSKGKEKRGLMNIQDHISVSTIDGQTIYQCNQCQKQFKTKAHIKYHEFCQKKDDEKPFKCEQCGKHFIKKSHYEYHLKTHTGERPYPCPNCGKCFIQRSKLSRHMNSKHLACQKCNGVFCTRQALSSHMLTHKIPLDCTYCNKRFTKMSNLKKHLIIHTRKRPFKSDQCGKSFGLKWTLDAHQKTHSAERPHLCDQCPSAFLTGKDLRRHHLIHSDELPFKCRICGRAFRRKDNLERHIRNAHDLPQDVSKIIARETSESPRTEK